MHDHLRLIHSSSNGDRWLLVGAPHEGKRVRHVPNRSSGGAASEVDIPTFLAQSRGPQHEALLAMLQDDGRGPAPREKGPMTMSAAQIRAGRALLDWSRERLALEANVQESNLAAIETVGAAAPDFELGRRIVKALEHNGVVLVGEGEVSSGGPGVRMGALGTSTGRPVEVRDTDHNDNVTPVGADRSGAAGQ